MPSFSEMNTKVNISIGLIIALILATFAVTTFYNKMSTLEDRMNKRHKRTEKHLDSLDKSINKLTDGK